MQDEKTLLDYYTKSMMTHATITVAIVFGLFSILNLISTKELIIKIGLSAVYFLLGLFGWYEIRRYLYCGKKAKSFVKHFGVDEYTEANKEKTIVGFVAKHIWPHIISLYWFFMIYCFLIIWLDYFI
ncbi:MAG: hypothetical protein ACQXXH_00300 [Candidatus Bathyarchaeia archaeon]|jgi:hypothetical protein